MAEIKKPLRKILGGSCTLGATRTHNLLLRKQLLYPLSYEGFLTGVKF